MKAPVRTGMAWLAGLLWAAAGLAQAAEPELGRGSIPASAIRDAIRDTNRSAAAANATSLAIGQRPALPAARSSSDAANAWKRHLGGPGEREAYDCALSFGIGGTVGGGEAFLGTRALGQTQVWRDAADRAK